MIPLIGNFVHEILFHEDRARLWFRAFLLWAGAIGAQVALGDYTHWNRKEWALHLVVAAVAGSAGLVSSTPPASKSKP